MEAAHPVSDADEFDVWSDADDDGEVLGVEVDGRHIEFASVPEAVKLPEHEQQTLPWRNRLLGF